MGLNFATELADMDNMPLEQQINIHLQYNIYPPVTSSMVIPCVEAIEAFADMDYNREIELPQGISWRGQDTCPASAIVEGHKLYPWVDDDEEF